jgi:hypothetical protein
VTGVAIKAKDRDVIVQALQAGVVPRTGLAHVQVGRVVEVSALVQDVDRIVDGGSAVRFVIGEYGAGKTFFLNLVRSIALEKRCVTMHADLGPERRIFASAGQARSLYQEAVRNLATRARPEGGALQSIVERFISECMKEATADRGVEVIVEQRLAGLQDMLGGYDYATVLKAYWRGSQEENEALKTNALRWLRGEYSTKTEARSDLGVRTIIEDATVYDSIKLLSGFVRIAGYAGLVVMFDEMVNIYKLQNVESRTKNYEQLLRITNDLLQGHVEGLGFLFGGTPEFLMDSRRGVYSYAALQGRLQENPFAKPGMIDVAGPVIRLQSLTTEDLYLLLEKIRAIFALGKADDFLVPDEALIAFMQHCSQQVGEAYFRTPRNTIRRFVQLLSVLQQNPGQDWRQLLGDIKVEKDQEEVSVTDVSDGGDDDELASITL